MPPRRRRPPAAEPVRIVSPRFFLAAGAAAALTLAASCASRPVAPAPTPPPPAPTPAPPPAPAPLGWEEAPLAAGDWTWRDDGGVSAAAFGAGPPPAFLLRCERGRELSLVRAGARGTSLIVRSSSGERRLPASVQPDGLTARVAPSDPLLDDVVFSRGRFAVEAEGAPSLVLPAWPEPARVIEDCRG
jgi:hypothetical protein